MQMTRSETRLNTAWLYPLGALQISAWAQMPIGHDSYSVSVGRLCSCSSRHLSQPDQAGAEEVEGWGEGDD